MHFRALLQAKFNAAFSLKVAENYIYSYEMHKKKNCCHQSCSFWPRYAPNRLSAGASPQIPLGELIAPPDSLAGLGGGTPRGGGKREGREMEGRVGGIGTPPPETGRGEGNGGKDGVGG